jgi:hypothetical protein
MRIKNPIVVAIVLSIAMFIISEFFQQRLSDKNTSLIKKSKLDIFRNYTILYKITSDTILLYQNLNIFGMC